MKIIITGAYAIGTHLARLLSRNHEDITLIDSDPDRLERIGSDYDLLTMVAQPDSIKALIDAGIKHTDLFIAVTPNQSLNLNCCMLAKALGAHKTVARIDRAEYIEDNKRELFMRLGVDELIYPEVLAARDINNGLKMSWVRKRWDVHNGALILLAIKLREGCEILNRPLSELCTAKEPYYIVAVKRKGETIIPGGNDELKLYDLAYIMTTRQSIPYIRKIVGKEEYADIKNVMIMGGGNTAVTAIKGMPEYLGVKVIESDMDRCEELNNLLTGSKALVINGDGRDLSLLTEESINNTQAFVALTGNAETNILACLTAKRMGVRKTVAMVENLDYVSMADSLDIGTLINKKAIAASRIYQLMLDADVLNVTFLMSANADIAEFIPKENSKITQKPVCQLNLPRGMALGGLVRDGKGMLVSGSTQIMAGDTVVVFCHNLNLKKIEKLFI